MTNAVASITLSALMLSGSPVLAQGKSSTESAADAVAQAAMDAAEAVADAAEQAEARPAAPPAIAAPPPIGTEPIPGWESREDYMRRQPQPVAETVPWLLGKDLPPESWKAGELGSVGYRLEITKTGEVDSCLVEFTSGFAQLDRLTCDLLMERAKVLPGTDPDGNPVAGHYSDVIYWEREEPTLQSSYTIKVRFVRDENGEESDCEVLEVSGELPERVRRNFERAPCPGNSVGRKGVPYRDENGVPVAREIRMLVQIELGDEVASKLDGELDGKLDGELGEGEE